MYRILKSFKLVIVFLVLQSSLSFSSNIENSTNHIKTIVFGAGCFWSVEKKFQETFGVIDVESGYADGANIKPLYKEIIKRENRFNPDNYAEVVRVTYNNNKTNLENLLKTFFEMHDPTQENRQGNDIGTQYRSCIMPLNEKQENAARSKIVEMQDYFDKEIVTTIEEPINFVIAEKYHHDYYERNPGQGYCMAVVGPKISKIRQKFAHLY